MLTGEKIKRELARPFNQIANFFWSPARRVAGALRRNRYDAAREKFVRVSEGKQKEGREVAVLLIYQPSGVLESTFFTLSYLLNEGISPVVVSNLPLADTDRDRLAANSWLVIERPNVGYDFGGYREGILTVFERGVQPKALYVLNDSIWFPLSLECDVIKKCRAAPEDIYGIQFDTWKKGRKKWNFIHSYFYRFSEGLVSSKEFCDYWRNMKLIEGKNSIIEEREVKLTLHFTLQGFSAGGIFSRKSLVEFVNIHTDQRKMDRILEYQCSISNKEAKYLRPIIHGKKYSPLSVRDQLAQLIEEHLVFRHTLPLHPWIHQSLDLGYVKKTFDTRLKVQRDEIRRLGLHLDCHPAVRDEIERWDSA